MVPWITDSEVFPNCFVAVFYNPITEDYKIFGLWEDGNINEMPQLVKFLKDPKNIFIGYNIYGFDGPVYQSIIECPEITTDELRKIRDSIITSKSKQPLIPTYNWDFKGYCLYKMWHYDNRARATSLKHLEFVYRMKSIKDLPYHHDSKINTQTAYNNVISYCKHDVKATYIHFLNSKEKIKARRLIKKKFDLNLDHSSDSSMGMKIILYNLAKAYKTTMKSFRNKYTEYKKINIATIPRPEFKARTGICKRLIDDHFSPIVLHGEKDPETGRMVFNLKENKYEFDWSGITSKVGFGGIHGCIEKGVYDSDSDWIIKSSDVTSQYPNAVINWNIFPKHLGAKFCKVFREKVYNERGKYPKKTHFAMNNTYKLACNAAVGKFADKYSSLYDIRCNLQVTVNCQLGILALAEDLIDSIPGAQLLMLNTDGLEIRIPRSYESIWKRACNNWEKLTKFKLEHIEYQKLVIDNVNNYIALSVDGKVKRKGRFRIYDDFLGVDSYHNDPSATIIPLALNEYFTKGTPIEDTVNACNNIHEFVFGVKKTKAFNYVVLVANTNRTVSIKKYKERVFRYYISTSAKAGNLYKLWMDGRLNAINKGDLIIPCRSLRSPKASKYPDLNREYYINKAHEIRSEIEAI